MADRDDSQLLARLGGADRGAARHALHLLYERHAAAIRALAMRILQSDHDADDLLQDTFVTMTRRADTFRSGSVRAWLLTIAGNRARDVLRRRGRAPRTGPGPVDASALQAPQAEPDTGLRCALAALPATWREALELRFVDGLEHGDVAEVLGVSLRTAKEWSRRGLDRLRELLEDDRND